jgi:hypothetical protein
MFAGLRYAPTETLCAGTLEYLPTLTNAGFLSLVDDRGRGGVKY